MIGSLTVSGLVKNKGTASINSYATNIAALTLAPTNTGKLLLLGGTLDEPDLYHLEVESRLYGTLSVAYDWKLKDYGGINDQTVLTFAGQDGMIGIGVTNPVYKLQL
jgi:hypothetical protein